MTIFVPVRGAWHGNELVRRLVSTRHSVVAPERLSRIPRVHIDRTENGALLPEVRKRAYTQTPVDRDILPATSHHASIYAAPDDRARHLMSV